MGANFPRGVGRQWRVIREPFIDDDPAFNDTFQPDAPREGDTDETVTTTANVASVAIPLGMSQRTMGKMNNFTKYTRVTSKKRRKDDRSKRVYPGVSNFK